MTFKIYTKTGDKGATSLVTGQRVPKDHQRIEAYGTVDELNAVLALLRSEILSTKNAALAPIGEAILQVQERLFSLGSELACFDGKISKPLQDVVLVDSDITFLEQGIDKLWTDLPALTNFVLPGGTTANSYAHLARTVCRRAERQCVALAHGEPVREIALIYLNRLSDWLFAVSRYVSLQLQSPEILWQPRRT